MNKLSEDVKAQRALQKSISKKRNATNSVRHNRNKLYRLLGMHIMRNYPINKQPYTYAQFNQKYTIIKSQKK